MIIKLASRRFGVRGERYGDGDDDVACSCSWVDGLVGVWQKYIQIERIFVIELF